MPVPRNKRRQYFFVCPASRPAVRPVILSIMLIEWQQFQINSSDRRYESQVQRWVTLTYLARSQRLINLGLYNLYHFRIHSIERLNLKMVDLSFFVGKHSYHDISENTRSGGTEIGLHRHHVMMEAWCQISITVLSIFEVGNWITFGALNG